MSNQIKNALVEIANEEVRKFGYAPTGQYAEVIESLADRAADRLDDITKALVEAVAERHGEPYAEGAVAVLVEFGLMDPEPEPEEDDEEEFEDDVTTEALDDTRLSRLEQKVDALVRLAERHLGRVEV
jgi:hypothetical protein